MIEQVQLEDKTNEELFKEYKVTKNNRIKQELVLRYVYIIKNIALKMKGVYTSFAQMDDIINESVIVLMNSIDKFEPEMNVKFEAYISKRLRGLIIDMARKQDWIPRNVRKNARLIDDATNVLYNKLGRFPTDQEMADYLKVPLDKYQNKMLSKTNLHNLISLDSFFENSNTGQTSGIYDVADNGILPEQFLEDVYKRQDIWS